MITCKSGVTIRTSIASIREAGRATQGVKLISLDEGDEIAAITKLNDHEVEGTDPEVQEEGAPESLTEIANENPAENPIENSAENLDEENSGEESENGSDENNNSDDPDQDTENQ
jgi:DNA gyrase subunit A